MDRQVCEDGLCVFKEKSVLLVTSSLLCLKCLLIPTYHSTDFEVHRNWMALTNNLSVDRWYYDQTSQWTLDYPPFFGYLEYFIGKIGSYVVPSSLVLQQEPIFSLELLYFHRFSIISMDLFYIMSCGFCANSLGYLMPTFNRKAITGLYLALVANVSLIMVDNIHFQYNAFLTSLLLFSLGFVLRGRFLAAALLFCVLLNFKHIYLYYAPAYVIFYLIEYLFHQHMKSALFRTIKLAIVMVVPFLLSFGPFVHYADVNVIPQILSRLFPFQRGLTHAYWAPNLWACYNFIDLSYYHILKFFGRIPPGAQAPKYTSGLVQEYSHSVLPNIPAAITLVLILLLLLPMMALLFRKSKAENKFEVLLTHSAFAFFLAGYHVHEKAVIMVTIPYTVLAFSDHRYMNSLAYLSLVANISLFPLFFTPFENLIKVALTGVSYFFLKAVMELVCFEPKKPSIWTRLYLFALIAAQLYSMIFHRVLFGEQFEFVPLMITSLSTAFGVILCFIEFLSVSYLNISKPNSFCGTKVQTKKL